MMTPKVAPLYTLYRTLTAADATPADLPKDAGINMSGYRYANIQVIPAVGTAAATVHFWSEELSKWVPHNPALAPTTSTAPFEFEVECNGRLMLVALATNGGKILVSGFDPRGNA